ncbi:hypothetical protein B4915_08510 [Leucobacter massiliensis]|uniref:Uncharacterized protein n=1 Tax=Leucobacter massiliensis TaxID=1686285 RepID=A0A2S9QP30_9MICO|nr:hypothetical protein B4915_08510 [Leucobacter massiliensis]
MGGAVTWGEARDLIEAAASDPSTALGAELAGWAYSASTLELLSLIAQVGDPKASKRLMPWALETPRRKKSDASAEEIAEATAALESGIVFSS